MSEREIPRCQFPSLQRCDQRGVTMVESMILCGKHAGAARQLTPAPGPRTISPGMRVGRGDAWRDEGPVYAVRWACPVDDCDWYLDVGLPATLPEEQVEVFGVGPSAWATQVSAIEQALKEHLDEHTAVEFATTIYRLGAALRKRDQ